MIDARCACGGPFSTSEDLASAPRSCPQCGRAARFVAAEVLPEGAGTGDFDAVLSVEQGPRDVGAQLFLGGVMDIDIGRLPERHLCLPGTRVSRLHARLIRVDFGPSRWRIVDNDSANGLLVNDEPVKEKELAEGDLVRVGEYALRYHVADSEPLAAVAAEHPMPAATMPVPAALARVSRAAEPALLTASPKAEYLYWLLLLFMLPLVVFTLRGNHDDVSARFEQTMSHASDELVGQVNEVRAAVKQELRIEGPMPPGIVMALVDAMGEDLPDGRLDGALLPRHTWMHWGFALLSAGAFFAMVVWMFPLGAVTRSKMLLVGLFTGTLGIILLLTFQVVVDWTQDVWIRGRGIVTLLFYVIKFIGFSYRSALNPENGFLLSFMGFTFGVGLCEELCKVLPLYGLFHSNTSTPSWRGACMWGLASGVGFGVSEGITYSSDYYNGIESGEIYLVRFASCVALHAAWAAAAGISLYRYRDRIEASEHWLGTLATIVAILIVPIVLHGLYDTLLKREMNVLALAAAVASFAWMAWQIEHMRRQENALVPAMA